MGVFRARSQHRLVDGATLAMARIMKSVSYSYVEVYRLQYSLEVLCIDYSGIKTDISKKFATYEELQAAIEAVVTLFPEGEPVEDEEMAYPDRHFAIFGNDC